MPNDHGGEVSPDAAVGGGKVVWVKHFGNVLSQAINDVAVAKSGAIYLVGNFSGDDLIIDGCKVNATNKSVRNRVAISNDGRTRPPAYSSVSRATINSTLTQTPRTM